MHHKEVPLSQQLQFSHVVPIITHIKQKFTPQKSLDIEFSAEIFGLAEDVIFQMNQLSPNPEENRKGGVLLLHQPGIDGNSFTELKVVGEDNGGNPSSDDELDRSNVDKHTLYALGKGLILMSNPGLLSSGMQNEISSEVSHLQLKGKDIPGGAIRFKGIIYSFSGYKTAADDECVILAILEKSGSLTRMGALAYAKQLGNEKYHSIAEKLVGH